MIGSMAFHEGTRETLFWFEKIADGFHDFENNCFKKKKLFLTPFNFAFLFFFV